MGKREEFISEHSIDFVSATIHLSEFYVHFTLFRVVFWIRKLHFINFYDFIKNKSA